MKPLTLYQLLAPLILALSACGGSSGSGGNGNAVESTNFSKFPTEGIGASDQTCNTATYPSIAWTQCESTAFAKILEAPIEQATNPDFLARLLEQSSTNTAELIMRASADPSWLLLSSPLLSGVLSGLQNPQDFNAQLMSALGNVLEDPAQLLSVNLNTPLTPLTTTFAGPAIGDPFRYREAQGSDGEVFYRDEAVVTPVVFYDSGCARLSGRIWRPKNVGTNTKLPGIVINNGSVQAQESAYWWAAQALVRNGYEVMTFDPRGQGRSDFVTPTGGMGTNVNPSVFWLGLVDAIDFFRSSPSRPYPNNAACQSKYPTKMTAFNPAHAVLDLERLGLAGHSLGAIGVSVVQGYGAPNADPWPGKLDSSNPVDVIVAWDGLLRPEGGLIGGAFQGGGVGELLDTIGLTDPVFRLVVERGLPKFGIRVPAMGQSSDYGLLFTPFLTPPDSEQRKKQGFNQWVASDVPSMEFTILGGTHLEWSLLPGLPATSWCPDTSSGNCQSGWGVPMARHYSLAWFDRWLKQSGEVGFADADARLLDDGGEQGANKMSYRYLSARYFPDRSGLIHQCEDIRAGKCSGGH